LMPPMALSKPYTVYVNTERDIPWVT